MTIKRCGIALLAIACVLFASCSDPKASPTAAALPSATPTPAPTVVQTPKATPGPTPSKASPSPSAAPSATSAPTPLVIPPDSGVDKNKRHEWETLTGNVDIMMIAPHPDDDQLYLGAIIPTYTQQSKRVVTVFMTYSNLNRRQEALNGVYTVGERIFPVFGPCKDKYLPGGHTAKNIKDAKKLWPNDETLPFLVEQVRKYKPSVIFSMDIDYGEYQNGEHMLTATLAQQVFSMSADPSCYPDSAKMYGTWQAAKLFLHLYKNNKLYIDADAKLPMFGGKTAFQMAKLGYKCHISQNTKYKLVVRDKGKSNICDFGLALSMVGYENAGNDIFDQITPTTMEDLNRR